MSNPFSLVDTTNTLNLASLVSNNAVQSATVTKDAAGGFFPGPGWSTVLSSGSGFSSAGVNVNVQTMLQLSAAHACVDKISSDIAKLPIKLFKKVSKQYRRVEEHYLLDLLRKPNRRTTEYEMKYQTVYSYLCTGNGYLVMIIGKNGVPQGLIPMPVGRPTVITEKRDGSLVYTCTNSLFKGYDTSNPQESNFRRVIDEDEMIHLRRMSMDGIRGTSPLATAPELFGLGLAAQSLAANVFKNGATFGYVISTPMKLTTAQVDQTQTDFLRNQAGIANGGKPPILHSGTTIEKITMTPEEAQLLPMREHIDAEICRVFGVPHALLGIASGDSQTYKNLESDMRSYVDSTLMNIITPFEELLNQRLLFDPDGKALPEGGATRGEYRFRFDTSELLRADKQARYTTYKTGVDSRFLLPNEARAEEGLAPIDGGDVFPDPAKTINLNRTGPKGDEPDILPDADS